MRLKKLGCNSFDPDTPVLMADGTKKPIKDVKIGDKVLATDPETGQTRPEPVTDVITGSGDKNMVLVTVKTAAGTGTVLATDEHPFWDATRKTWTDAEDLQPGTTLRDHHGRTSTITTTRHLDRTQTVHNLTINNLHTYYVLAGSTAVLVHNSGGELTPEQLKSIRSLEARAAEHQAKLEAYKADPWAYDNKGLLERAPNEEVRQRIINGRINHLEKEISEFQKQADDLKRLGGLC